MEKMKIYYALPTWIITGMAQPLLPKKHPWHGRSFSLEHWYKYQTELCREFDTCLWIVFLSMISVFLILLWK